MTTIRAQRFTDGTRQVTAMRYTGLNGHDLQTWCGDAVVLYGSCRPVGIRGGPWVPPGAWIVNTEGCLSMCPADQFEATYRPV